jgi:hypothetical protein
MLFRSVQLLFVFWTVCMGASTARAQPSNPPKLTYATYASANPNSYQ